MSAGTGAGGAGARGRVRAAVLVAPDAFTVRTFARPEVRPDTALVDVELFGICGTDLKYASGKLPSPLPLILGHEFGAIVAAVGPDALDGNFDPLQVGTRVAVDPAQP